MGLGYFICPTTKFLSEALNIGTVIIHIAYATTVSSGIQDGLISKLEGNKSVLYSRLSNFYVGIR